MNVQYVQLTLELAAPCLTDLDLSFSYVSYVGAQVRPTEMSRMAVAVEESRNDEQYVI